MKAALFFAIAASASAVAQMTARFSNGDLIHGTLESLDDRQLVWSADAFPESQPFRIDRLLDLTLPGNPGLDPPEGDHIAIVRLTNGDEVRGSLTRVTDKEIRIRTNFAGDLSFRRDMVDGLSIEDKPELYYSGPISLDGWHQGDGGEWVYESGALISKRSVGSAHLARDVGKHEKYRLAFDIEWKSSALFRLMFCADNLNPDEIANGFDLNCQPQYVTLRKRVTRNGRGDSIPIGTSVGVREFQEREKVRVEILHDQSTGRIRFMLGGRVVADWRDPAAAADQLGGGLHFIANPGSPLRISRIQISSWDGMIEGEWQEDGIDFMEQEEAPPETEKAPESPTGITLRNGDRVEGRILGIEDGVVQLESSFAKLELPVSRLSSFALRTAEAAADPNLRWEPIRRNGDVKAWFTDGGHITFQLVGFSDQGLFGKSQTFGEAIFNPAAFSRIEFNIYRPELAGSRSSKGW